MMCKMRCLNLHIETPGLQCSELSVCHIAGVWEELFAGHHGCWAEGGGGAAVARGCVN